MIDDYNDWNIGQNSLGFWTGGNLPSMYETFTPTHDGTKCRRFYTSSVASVVFSGTTTSWQEVTIPLSSFSGLDKTRVRALSMVFQGSSCCPLSLQLDA